MAEYDVIADNGRQIAHEHQIGKWFGFNRKWRVTCQHKMTEFLGRELSEI